MTYGQQPGKGYPGRNRPGYGPPGAAQASGGPEGRPPYGQAPYGGRPPHGGRPPQNGSGYGQNGGQGHGSGGGSGYGQSGSGQGQSGGSGYGQSGPSGYGSGGRPGYGQGYGQGNLPGYAPGGGPPYGSPNRHAQYVAPPPQPQYGPPSTVTDHPPKRRGEPHTSGGLVTEDDERWAVPAYIGLFVGGFVAPAIVYAVKRRTSPFARFHAAQALNLFIVMSVANILSFTLAFRIGVTGLMVALAVLAAESFCIIKAAIGANRCEWYRIPPIIAWPIVR